MDVDDVSHVGQWAHLLRGQQAALQAASKRRGERPMDRKPRRQLINEFMVHYVSQRLMLAQRNHHLHQSWVAPPYPPSVAALGSLRKLLLKDLYLETHHRGSYVLLRAATPSNVMTAVLAIMEDEKGDGVVFQLYQQRADDYRTVGDVIQEGSICIVKEPYFKVMIDGGYGLRVDHVSDIVWLSADDEKIPAAWKPRISDLEKDAMELKEEGSRALKAGKLYEAAEIYTQALKHAKTAEGRRIIQLNRSLVNLKLGYYDQALQDAGTYSPSENSEKSFYRAARSLYELGKFQESHDRLKSLLSQFPNCLDAQRELVRTEYRLKEQEYGYYDFKSMYKAAKNTPPHLDCATYLGPVAVKSSENRGRGLFTTKDVVAGEMLLCEKAFSYCWADARDNQDGSKTSLLMNTTTDRMVMGTQPDLITTTVQKLYRNPSLIPAFNSLHHGDYKPVEATRVDGSAVVDTFLVDRIISLNVFGCPRTSLETHFRKSQTLQQQREQEIFHTCGVFINASYINHSCESNARRSFIGDMQIVCASRNIPANTEITFWYHVPDPALSYQQMQAKFENWGFTCQCAICEHLKTTKKKDLTKRNALLRDLKEAFEARPSANLAKAERLLTAIEKTYPVPASAVPRLPLWDPYLLLTRFYSAANNHPKAIETAWKVLESLGYVIEREDAASFEVKRWGLMQDRLIETWVHLWTAYARVAPASCRKVEECARIAYKICVGEDETFEEKYGALARRAMAGKADLVGAFQSMAF